MYNVEGKIKIPRELVQGLSSGPRAQSVYNVEPIIYVSVIVSLGSFVADWFVGSGYVKTFLWTMWE